MTDQNDDPLLDQVRRDGGGVASGIAVATSMLLIGLAATFAPRIEGVLFPIFRSNDIAEHSVVRVDRKLCWTRVGEKIRTPPLNDVNVDVDYISDVTGKLAHQPTAELYDAQTGEELTSDVIPPAGPFSKNVCLTLSHRIRPDQPVRVRQVAFFQSATGLYDVPVVFPIIVDPPSAAAVFASRHDTAPGPDSDAVAGPPPSRHIRPEPQSDGQDDKTLLQTLTGKRADALIGDEVNAIKVQTTISDRDADRLEQYRVDGGLRSRAAALRDIVHQGLDEADHNAVQRYDRSKQ